MDRVRGDDVEVLLRGEDVVARIVVDDLDARVIEDVKVLALEERSDVRRNERLYLADDYALDPG